MAKILILYGNEEQYVPQKMFLNFDLITVSQLDQKSSICSKLHKYLDYVIDTDDVPAPRHQIHISNEMVKECLKLLPEYCKLTNNYAMDCIVIARTSSRILEEPKPGFNIASDLPCDRFSHQRIRSIEQVSEFFFNVDNTLKCITSFSEEEIKQLSKYFLSSKIVLPSQISEMKCTNKVFLIPSVINVTGNRLDAWDGRSVFNHSERCRDTVSQIQSLGHVKHSTTILLEGNYLSLQQMIQLTNELDYLVLMYYDGKANYLANQHPNKHRFEVYSLYKVGSQLKDIDYLCKFGGRYRLLPSFQEKNLFQDKPVIKMLRPEQTFDHSRGFACSVLYSIPCSYLPDFLSLLERNIDTEVHIETLLYNQYIDIAYNAKSLGIYGTCAVNGMVAYL